MAMCYFCKRELDIKETPGRSDVCSHCGNDLHCCLQCAFYDETCYNECRESQAEKVNVKDRANFCGWFRFGRQDKEREQRKEEARSALDKLFGG